MNELIIFENPEFGRVRSVEIDGEPWLVGKDVAQALGYSNTKDAISAHVDEEDRRILQRSEIATIENHIPKSALPMQLTGEAHGVNFSDAVLCGGNMIQEKVRIGDVNVVRFRFLEKEGQE